MIYITLDELLDGIRRRKEELGIVDNDELTQAMRNGGERRTEKKRAMLSRIENRSRKAELMPPAGIDVLASAITAENQHDEVDFGPPVGKEVL